jgi:hypothetical protein
MNHDTQRAALLAAIAAGPRTVGQLAEACWRADPETFGLEDLPYPDPRKVTVLLYGTKGVIKRGLATKERGVVSITERGRARLEGVPLAQLPPAPAPLAIALQLARCSVAFHKFTTGRKDTISFLDALWFWDAAKGQARAAVAEFGRLLADRDDERIRELGACHDWLSGRFGRRVEAA